MVLSINFASGGASGPNVLFHAAIVPLRKSVAYRKSPLLLLPIASPLYTGPVVRSLLATTVTADEVPEAPKAGCQAAIVPSSVAHINSAAAPPTSNAMGLPFQTMPE